MAELLNKYEELKMGDEMPESLKSEGRINSFENIILSTTKCTY